MRKTIKSGAEIRKDINALFENYTNIIDFIDRANNYLDNLSGKELYKKDKIESMINKELIDRYLNESIKFNPDNSSDEKFNNLKNHNEKDIKKTFKYNQNLFNHVNNKGIFLTLMSQFYFIDNKYSFESIINMSVSYQEFAKHRKSNPLYAKLEKYLDKNNEIAVYIFGHIEDLLHQFVVLLILKDVVPLKTLLIFFNQEQSIKENINRLYEISGKKIPRTSIQKVISDNITSIREDKFPDPFIRKLEFLSTKVPKK